MMDVYLHSRNLEFLYLKKQPEKQLSTKPSVCNGYTFKFDNKNIFSQMVFIHSSIKDTVKNFFKKDTAFSI